MKSLKFFFGLAITLISFQTIQAQDVTLVSNESNATLIMLGGIGEKTASGAEVVSALQEGVAITKMYDKFGLVNAQGVEIVAPRFDEIHPFVNGYAAAKLHGKWSFLSKQGKKLSSFRYDWVGNFEAGYAPVQLNGKWGFVNEQGIEICELEFDAVRSFQDGKALVRKGNNWYNMSEKAVLTPANVTPQAAIAPTQI
jgi:hypothetical protein